MLVNLSLGTFHHFACKWSLSSSSLPTTNTILSFIHPTLRQYFNCCVGRGFGKVNINDFSLPKTLQVSGILLSVPRSFDKHCSLACSRQPSPLTDRLEHGTGTSSLKNNLIIISIIFIMYLLQLCRIRRHQRVQ